MIRAAELKDVPAILGLIRELAVYEKLEGMFVATEALLGEHLFGEEKVVDALVAEVNGTVVGYAIYFKTFSTFSALPGIYLEDLYVQQQHRGKGLGTGMLRRLARLAAERGYGRVEWTVLDWNEPSIGFYKSLGAERMGEWSMFRLTGDALRELANK